MNKIFITTLFSLCMLLAPQSALASEVSFQPAEHLDRQDKAFTTTLVLNTQDESINAVEGVLAVDSRLVESIQLSDSGSFLTYWVSRPAWDSEQNVIRFSGAVPGGYIGTNGILFSIIFSPYSGEPIDRAVSVLELKAYKNDGMATSAKISNGKFSLGDIAGQVDTGLSEQLYLDGTRKDNVPPEVFSPQLAQDELAFDGKWFINFATTDKQSGVDHYEIQESRSGKLDAGKWKTATSPYVLEDQELHSFIYVIAIDRQGNERIIKVFPRKPLPWTKQYGYEAGAVGLLVLAGGAMYFRRGLLKTLKKS
jgi:hypothetical protein